MSGIAEVIKIIDFARKGVEKHYQKLKLQYVEVPAIVGITGACENVDTLFKVGNRLDLPLFFTQTGQLALEQALEYYPGVYTIIHSGRDEEKEDERHLRQFRLTEEEFDCTMVGMERENYSEEKMFEALLEHIEKATKAMIKNVTENCAINGRNEMMAEILKKPYLRINYNEAIKIVERDFGDDLGAEDEAKIVEVVNKRHGNGAVKFPVFITHYPKEIKFFNMKVSTKDPRVVLSADLVFPIAGEAVGSAVREHDGDKLRKRLLKSTMFKLHKERGGRYEDFQWYVDDLVMAGKTNPHAGYGIGNERIIQFILGEKDIRKCSLFSLMAKQTNDWDRKRKGTLYLFARTHKKVGLLSIGRIINKRRLLPFIKKIYQNGFVFYATEKTHQFLKKHGIETTLVHKISQFEKKPNLVDLLRENFFDLIINIPTRRNKRNNREFTDGQLIRRAAIETGTTLITETEVAQELFERLYQRKTNE